MFPASLAFQCRYLFIFIIKGVGGPVRKNFTILITSLMVRALLL